MASPYPLRLFQIMMGEEIEMADIELELVDWTVPPSHRHRGKKVDVDDLYGSPCVGGGRLRLLLEQQIKI